MENLDAIDLDKTSITINGEELDKHAVFSLAWAVSYFISKYDSYRRCVTLSGDTNEPYSDSMLVSLDNDTKLSYCVSSLKCVKKLLGS